MERFRDKSMWAECVSGMCNKGILEIPSYEFVIDSMAKAENGDGWLSQCIDQGKYIVLNRQFLRALADFLHDIEYQKFVEICAGEGRLAAALISYGHEVTATDKKVKNSIVTNISAEDTLKKLKPDTVIGCFVPFDAGIDELVLADENVKNYIVLNAQLGGQFGSAWLWNNNDFHSEKISQVTKWMICRHDVWMGSDQRILTHGQAWHFKRK